MATWIPEADPERVAWDDLRSAIGGLSLMAPGMSEDARRRWTAALRSSLNILEKTQ